MSGRSSAVVHRQLDRLTPAVDTLRDELVPALRSLRAITGRGEAMARALLDLILSGRKRATAGCLESYRMEGEDLPAPGDDGDGLGDARVGHSRNLLSMPA